MIYQINWKLEVGTLDTAYFVFIIIFIFIFIFKGCCVAIISLDLSLMEIKVKTITLWDNQVWIYTSRFASENLPYKCSFNGILLESRSPHCTYEDWLCQIHTYIHTYIHIYIYIYIYILSELLSLKIKKSKSK